MRNSHIDFLKIDVEGYKPQMVRAMQPFLAERRIGKVLVDYLPPFCELAGLAPKLFTTAL